MKLNQEAADLANRRKAMKARLATAKLERERARGDFHERYERPVEDIEQDLADLTEELDEASVEQPEEPTCPEPESEPVTCIKEHVEACRCPDCSKKDAGDDLNWPKVFASWGRTGAMRDPFPRFHENQPGTHEPIEEYVPKSLYDHVAAEALDLTDECDEWKRIADSRLTKEQCREKLLRAMESVRQGHVRGPNPLSVEGDLFRTERESGMGVQVIALDDFNKALDAAFGDDHAK